MRNIVRTVSLASLLMMGSVYAQPLQGPKGVPQADMTAGKPRMIVLSDMGNEPDDQMSMVRLMLYSNEIDIEGLVATTSTWLRFSTNPQTMRAIIADYGVVRPNLMKNASGWPTAAALLATVHSGPTAYGMAALKPDHLSDGAKAIIDAADRPDPRPLWISIWGGTNTLAEALIYVRAHRTPEALATFVAKLRVYSISDQDDAGPWVRREFPSLFYVVKPSLPDGNEYDTATWTGISGDVFYRNADGADSSLVTNEWLETNIRSKGPLGKHYLRFAAIMEGDTPAFLNLINNGLDSWRDPQWGGWGGRYVWTQPYGETHPIFSQGGGVFPRTDSKDDVIGIDGKHHISDQATIWRWRAAYQNDFAARMDWTINDFAHANHEPVARIKGQPDQGVIRVEGQIGQPIRLDASSSRDPDGNKLRYHWFAYGEAGYSPSGNVGDVQVTDGDTAQAVITPVDACRKAWFPSFTTCPKDTYAHVILAVTDDGSPNLTSYRRVIVHLTSGKR